MNVKELSDFLIDLMEKDPSSSNHRVIGIDDNFCNVEDIDTEPFIATLVDDVEIYNRAAIWLTEDEIAEDIYNRSNNKHEYTIEKVLVLFQL